MNIANTFDLVRLFRCCGGVCVRPLCGKPAPCERCGRELRGTPKIVDRLRYVEKRLVEGVR